MRITPPTKVRYVAASRIYGRQYSAIVFATSEASARIQAATEITRQSGYQVKPSELDMSQE